MPDPVRIFVSHHHSPEEDAFTTRLVADLKAAGADVWVDVEGIASDDFVQKISEGLAGRQWLVLVMTPASMQSPWVQREVNAALAEQTAGRMLGVLPLVMTPCDIRNVPVLWRTLHQYDATSDYASARQHLFQVIGLTGQNAQPPELSHPSDMSSVATQVPLAASSQIQEFLLPSTGKGPTSIKPGPDGALWFIESKSHRIGRIIPQS